MSVGILTVEALNDQHAGLCRWKHAFRYVQVRASSTVAAGSSKTKPLHPAGGPAARMKARQEEEELRIVMYLFNWGPNN